MLTLSISEAEKSVLSYKRFSYPCVIVQKRLHAVYLKATQELTNAQVGLFCGLHPQFL